MIALRELLKECGIGTRERYALCEEPVVQGNYLFNVMLPATFFLEISALFR